MPVFTKTAPTQKRGFNITISSQDPNRDRIHCGTPVLFPPSVMSIAQTGERGLRPISGTSKYSTLTDTQTNGAGRKPLNGISPAFGG